MEIQLDRETPVIRSELLARWDGRLARFISNVLAPPFTGLAGLLVIALAAPTPYAWLWVVLASVMNIGIPIAYILWKVRSGAISDFHITIRAQRMRPILLSLACSTVTLLVFWLGKAPVLYLSLAGIGVGFVVVLLLITRFWKISGHSAAIASVSILTYQLLGHQFWPSLLLIPLVAWARVRLHRHTLAQTIAGTALGVVYIGLAVGF